MVLSTRMPFLQLALAVSLCVIVPGTLLLWLLLPKERLPFLAIPGPAFALGYALFCLPSTAAYVWEMSWISFGVMWGVELLVLAIWTRRRRPRASEQIAWRHHAAPHLALLVFLAVLTVTLAHRGAQFTGDQTHHLAYVRKLFDATHVDPYTAFFKDIREIPYSYAYCMAYVVLAFLAKVSAIDLRSFWEACPPVFAGLIVSAHYFFGLSLFRRTPFALIYTLVFCAFAARFNWTDFLLIPTPDQFARNTLLPTGLGFFLLGLRRQRANGRLSVAAALVAAAIALTHMYSFVAFFVPAGSTALLRVAFSRSKIKTLLAVSRVLLLPLVATVPFVTLRILRSNFLADRGRGELDSKYQHFVSEPLSGILLSPPMIVFLAASLILMFHWWKPKRFTRLATGLGPAHLFLVGGVATALALRWDRISALSAQIISTTYVRRYALYGINSPALLSFGVVAILALASTRHRRIKKITLNFGTAALALLIALSARAVNAPLLNHDYIMRAENVFTFINREIPHHQVFCSYGYPALELGSQTSNYILEGEVTHRPPVSGFEPREKALFRMLRLDGGVMAFLKANAPYGCRFVLLETTREFYNTNYDRPTQEYVSLALTRWRFALLPEVFRQVYQDDRFTLYSVDTPPDLSFLGTATLIRLRDVVAQDSWEEIGRTAERARLLDPSAEACAETERARQALLAHAPWQAYVTPAAGIADVKVTPPPASFPNLPEVVLDRGLFVGLPSSFIATTTLALDFGCPRRIRSVEVQWAKRDFESIHFRLEGQVDHTQVWKELPIRALGAGRIAFLDAEGLRLTGLRISSHGESDQSRLLISDLRIR